jgi:hypothetical protein
LFLDELGEREGGLLNVFRVLDVFAKVLHGLTMPFALCDEVEQCGELVGVSSCYFVVMYQNLQRPVAVG